MIYVTGDIHADLDRFRSKEAKRLKKGDILLVCGDFGFIWDGSHEEQKALRWLEKQKYQILFVEGTHDNLERLQKYPEKPWCGGKVREISKNILQLCRGNLFHIGSVDLFAFGGGESTDLEERLETGYWWPDELATRQEMDQALIVLQQAKNTFDILLTHDCSSRMRNALFPFEDHMNILNEFFDTLEETCTFRHWVFGCYHIDKELPPNHTAVFKRILPLRDC